VTTLWLTAVDLPRSAIGLPGEPIDRPESLTLGGLAILIGLFLVSEVT
jgi:hypothetical protein